MVKKAQIQFICITMTILFAVFAAILGVAYYVCRLSCHTSIVDKLSRLERSYEISVRGDTPFSLQDGLIVLKNPTAYSYEILDGSDLFDTNKIAEIVNTSFSRYPGVTASSIGKIYYRISLVRGGQLLVAADMTYYFDKAVSNTLKILLFLVVFYIILAFVVWGFSYKVFQPIKESIYKQRKFISDASHELKTPISVISANADVLKTNNEGDRYLDSIKSQTKRLNLLVTDMLTLARMDESDKTLIKENFNLSDVVTEAVLPFDAVAFENGKVLLSEIEKNVEYVGDRESVKKIIDILLDNAVKYTTNGGTIKVTLAKTTLVVTNSGSDVKDADSDKIFERFYRGEASRSRETGGSGLGLAIAKGIATKNGWNIFAKSKYGESMTITVEM